MRQHDKNCIECNTPFKSKRSDAKYCSGACKQHNCLKNKGFIKPDLNQLIDEAVVLKRLLRAYISMEPIVNPYLPIEVRDVCKKLKTEATKVINYGGKL